MRDPGHASLVSKNGRIILWVVLAVVGLVMAFLYVTTPPKWTGGKG